MTVQLTKPEEFSAISSLLEGLVSKAIKAYALRSVGASSDESQRLSDHEQTKTPPRKQSFDVSTDPAATQMLDIVQYVQLALSAEKPDA